MLRLNWAPEQIAGWLKRSHPGDVWEKPVSAAIVRIDQCIASTGVVRNVRSITAAT